MARSKNSPKLTWTKKICEKCTSEFRYTQIENQVAKMVYCKSCTVVLRFCFVCGGQNLRTGICCSDLCTKEKRKMTNIERYGTENVYASEIIKNKIKDKIIERYGVDHQCKSDAIKEKIRNTCVERYGVENPAQADEVKQKMKQTCQKLYGVDFAFQSDLFKETVIKSNQERYGVDYQSQLPHRRKMTGLILSSKGVRKKCSQTLFERYGVTHPFQLPKTREMCNNDESIAKKRETMRKNKSWITSRPEERLYQVLLETFPDTQRHVSVNRWDIDFHIPSIDVYVNMNGIYWHGKEKTEAQLIESGSKQDKAIARTIRRDVKRKEWFSANNKKFVVIWEDEIEIAISLIQRYVELEGINSKKLNFF